MSLFYLFRSIKNLQHVIVIILMILVVQLKSQNRLDFSSEERALTCGTTISSYPYAESFESGIGDWTQSGADDFDWYRNGGGTGSSGTGPSSANDGSWYMYTESSSPNYPNKDAIFISPCFDLNSVSNPVFAFDYHMYGASMGTLDLQASTDGTTWTSLWSLSGDQGNLWFSNGIDLSAYTLSTVQLRFVAEVANSYRSDFAIDNIRVNETTPCTGDITTFPYTEGFESGLGAWSQDLDDDFNWIRRGGSTSSNNTGPSSAYEGANYVYVEASNPNSPNKVTILDGPCIDLTSTTDANFSFYYHMYGGESAGSLDLQVSSSNGANWTSVWHLDGNQGNSWQNETVDLSAYDGLSINLRFVGVTGSTWQSDMAIDNIELSGTINLLPVELLNFEVIETETEQHQLYWKTASELNNSHFIVERSVDAIHFESIGRIEGNGNSNENLNYSFIEEQPFKGVNYYRLQQVDYDGTTSYSKIIHLNKLERIIKSLEIYPNPVKNHISLHGLEQFDETNAEIKVLNIQGNVLISQLYSSIKEGFVELTLESLTPGYYVVVVSDNANVATTNFVKQ